MYIDKDNMMCAICDDVFDHRDEIVHHLETVHEVLTDFDSSKRLTTLAPGVPSTSKGIKM